MTSRGLTVRPDSIGCSVVDMFILILAIFLVRVTSFSKSGKVSVKLLVELREVGPYL